jgi:hypothetical protein
MSSFDAASAPLVAAANTVSGTVAVAAGANRVLLAAVAVGANPDGSITTTATALQGGSQVAMTPIGGQVHTGGATAGFIQVYGMINPDTGTNTFILGCSISAELTGGGLSFNAADQVTGWGTPAVFTGGPNTTATGSIATTAGRVVAAFVAAGSSLSSATSPLVSRFIATGNSSTGAGNSAGATAPSTGSSVTTAWTISGSDTWSVVAVEILTAAAPPSLGPAAPIPPMFGPGAAPGEPFVPWPPWEPSGLEGAPSVPPLVPKIIQKPRLAEPVIARHFMSRARPKGPITLRDRPVTPRRRLAVDPVSVRRRPARVVTNAVVVPVSVPLPVPRRIRYPVPVYRHSKATIILPQFDLPLSLPVILERSNRRVLFLRRAKTFAPTPVQADVLNTRSPRRIVLPFMRSRPHVVTIPQFNPPLPITFARNNKRVLFLRRTKALSPTPTTDASSVRSPRRITLFVARSRARSITPPIAVAGGPPVLPTPFERNNKRAPFLRRAKLFAPVPPQVNPPLPMPFERNNKRAPFLRRAKVFAPVPAQQNQTPLPPLVARRPRGVQVSLRSRRIRGPVPDHLHRGSVGPRRPLRVQLTRRKVVANKVPAPIVVVPPPTPLKFQPKRITGFIVRRIKRFVAPLYPIIPSRLPQALGGTAVDQNFLGGSAIVASSLLGTAFLGGSAGSTNTFAGNAVNTNTLGGNAVSDPVGPNGLGGSIARLTVDSSVVGWTMQQQDITIGQYNDETLALTITIANPSPPPATLPKDITGLTLEIYLKPTAAALDTDPGVFKLSTATGEIVITNPTGGLATATIAAADITLTTTPAFWRLDILTAGKRNTALFGAVHITDL